MRTVWQRRAGLKNQNWFLKFLSFQEAKNQPKKTSPTWMNNKNSHCGEMLIHLNFFRGKRQKQSFEELQRFFRKTNSIRDWKTNFSVKKSRTRWKNMEVYQHKLHAAALFLEYPRFSHVFDLPKVFFIVNIREPRGWLSSSCREIKNDVKSCRRFISHNVNNLLFMKVLFEWLRIKWGKIYVCIKK